MQLETMEQVELLGDDLKVAIIELAIQPTTVSELAASLGVPRTRLYHHVKRLVEHGFLRVVRQRSKGPVVESVYQTAALTYRPSRQLLASLSSAEVGAALLSIVFGPAKAEFVAALDEGIFALTDTRRARQVSVGRHLMHLTPKELHDLIGEVEALYARYDPDPAPRPGTIPVAALSVVHPRRRVHR